MRLRTTTLILCLAFSALLSCGKVQAGVTNPKQDPSTTMLMNLTAGELKSFFGSGDIVVTFSLQAQGE